MASTKKNAENTGNKYKWNENGYERLVGERIKAARERNGETQKELAEYLGYTGVSAHKYIAEFETGQRLPKTELLIKIAMHYSVSADYLLGLTGTPELEADKKLISAELHLNELATECLCAVGNYGLSVKNDFFSADFVNLLLTLEHLKETCKKAEKLQKEKCEDREQLQKTYEEMGRQQIRVDYLFSRIRKACCNDRELSEYLVSTIERIYDEWQTEILEQIEKGESNGNDNES